MNTDDTVESVDIEDVNLDDFEKEFFGKTEEVKAEEVEDKVDDEDIDETEDQSLATDDDEDEDADEENDDDEDDDSDEEEEVIEEVPAPKAKRNRTQERIEKLVAEARQAERERDALRIELERLRSEPEKKVEQKSEGVKQLLPPEAPSPDAVDKDGEPLYELGEFDPKFIRDLTKFTIEQETKAAREEAQREAAQAQVAQAQKEIADKWLERVDEVEKEIPELRENLAKMADTFQDIDPNYGEYLASAIMISEVGPQIMNYLSQNITEAQKIVASGPAAATLAIGRLEAKFIKEPSTEQVEKRNTKQVSKASPPPEEIERARGRGGRFAVAPDTDDLKAFEREFFKRPS